MLRLLFVVSFHSRLRRVASGGMERCVWALRHALSPGHEILIVCRDADGEMPGVRALGPLHDPHVRLTPDEMLDRYIERVVAFERAYDLVITYNFPEILPSLSKPCLCLFFDYKDDWLPRGSGASEHTFVFPARWMRDAFAEETGQAPARCEWLPMGVDVKLFYPARDPPGVRTPLGLIFSSVWHPGKGVEAFLGACERLDRAGVPFRAILAGSTGLWDFGDQQESIYPLAERRRIEDVVNYYRARLRQLEVPGEVPHVQMPELLRRSDLVVAPSVWRECLPLTIIEGMAVGTPAIAPAHGGAAELIEDGVSGYLLKNPDDKSIAFKVEEVIGGGGVTMEMRDTARQAVLPLNWDSVAGRFEMLFQ